MLDLDPTEDAPRDPMSQSETSPRQRHSSLGTIKAAAADSVPTEPYRHHRRRSSAFLEVGLGGDDAILDAKIRRSSRPKLQVRFNSKVEVVEADAVQWPDEKELYTPSWQRSRMHQSPPPFFPTLPRILFLVCVLALIIPSWNNSPLLRIGILPIGAKAGPVKIPQRSARREIEGELVRRQNGPTDYCVRWSQQTALVNGTVYSYGGHTSTQPQQTQNTWNNDFLTLDLTTNWEISSPTLKGLAQPSGPPAVSNGYLWNSYDTLYLYGGEFSDSPVTSPVPFSTWSYDIASSSWTDHSSPVDVAGVNSDGGNVPVQRAAEGAGASVPNLGRGYYFGGHLDGYTTVGWSQSIARVYLTSLLEYTFPGYSNSELSNNAVAGSDGTYRNITQGGSQSTAGFPERADGVLVYIPGFSTQGILIGLAGGTNATFTQMNIIDIYDIAHSTWYKQATSGPTPKIRVNPCAVAVSAADGSSIQVYMYGGQNLVPYEQQIQYSDTWILSIPSFTWIEVDTSTQSVPPARAGHTCNIWNSQMVVFGGYVGTQLSCDVGVYVFNTSALSWQNEYITLDSSDALNRQDTQKNDPNALQGSYGYEVPAAVQKVVGGNAAGGATVTAPVQTPLSGPLATGRPKTYTMTAATTITTTSNGQVVTKTSSATVVPGSTETGSSSPSSGSSSSSSNTAAIAAGVVAGFFALLAAYLGFCAWIYRKQLKLYKNHVAMSQRAQLAGDSRYLGPVGGRYSDKAGQSGSSSNGNGNAASGERVSGESPSLNSRGNGNGNGDGNGAGLGSNNPYRNATATAASSTEDLMAGQEPSFLGVMLNPRRSLRVVNRD